MEASGDCRSRSRRGTAGVTLVEILIAVTLLSALTVAMLFALRIGLSTFAKTGDRLMDNRRVAGAQRILLDQIEGIVPVVAPCFGPERQPAGMFPFFQGEQQAMRFVSTYSLQESWRGQARILEFTVIPGDRGRGVRLVVNEVPYTSPAAAGGFCLGMALDPATRAMTPRFPPVSPGPASFVLADNLEFCRFSFLGPPTQPGQPSVWTTTWTTAAWPRGVRIEMMPIDRDPTRVQPMSVTAAIRVFRSPQVQYGDY